MKEERYFYVPRAPEHNELPEEEAQHALRVLRLKEGDEIMLMDGEGTFYHAHVTLTSAKHCFYDIVDTLPQKPAWKGHLHLAIAPTKMMERMEWLAEKATEIGFDEMSFLDCRFSERRVIKTPRVERIIVAAMKQSRKAWKPKVNDIQDFQSFIACHNHGYRFIAHCYQEVERVSLYEQLKCLAQSSHESSDNKFQLGHETSDNILQPGHEPQGGVLPSDILVMIGPEGDFSIDEVRQAVDAGFVSVDLGKSRLRTETAGLSAVMMMQLSHQTKDE